MVKQRAGLKAAKFENVKVPGSGEIALKSSELQWFEPDLADCVDTPSCTGRRRYSVPVHRARFLNSSGGVSQTESVAQRGV